MQEVPISEVDVQRCNDLITLAGLPKNISSEYESYFSSNRKVIAIYNNLVLEVGNVEYYDAPEGEICQGDIVIPKRRIKWRQRFLRLPDEQSIDYNVVDFLINDGFNNGLPIGLVSGDEYRREEILSLGIVVENEFCQVINYKEQGELRIYNSLAKIKGKFEDLPHITRTRIDESLN